jgi:hypothetical protein
MQLTFYYSRTFAVSMLLAFVCILSTITSCKSNKKIVKENPPSVVNEQPVKTKTIGKVSHQYRATGCATVIIVTKDTENLVLIPKDKLANEMDVDGLEISFNYRTLKMPQPAGCSKGIPAALTDVEKK